jgi:hypothetical protein
MRFPGVILWLLAFTAGAPDLLAQDRPLPEPQAFLERARVRLRTDDERQAGYSYQETRRQKRLDGSGRVTRDTVRLLESYPGLPGEPRWNRVIAVNGKPLTPAELEKQDRDRQEKVAEYARKIERQTDKERAEATRDRERERREDAEKINDIFRVFTMKMLGRESLEGRDTIVFSLTPRPDAKPRTREGKVFQHFAGRVWLSEDDYELARVQVEAIDTISFGLGMVARIHQGSKADYQRRKVDGEWLPARFNYTGSVRVMLFKVVRVDSVSEFANYRKFTVGTDTRYGSVR